MSLYADLTRPEVETFSDLVNQAASHNAAQGECDAASCRRQRVCSTWTCKCSTAHPPRQARLPCGQGPAGWCVDTRLSVITAPLALYSLLLRGFVDQAPTDAIVPAVEAGQPAEQVPEATYQVPQPYQAPYGQVCSDFV